MSVVSVTVPKGLPGLSSVTCIRAVIGKADRRRRLSEIGIFSGVSRGVVTTSSVLCGKVYHRGELVVCTIDRRLVR